MPVLHYPQYPTSSHLMYTPPPTLPQIEFAQTILQCYNSWMFSCWLSISAVQIHGRSSSLSRRSRPGVAAGMPFSCRLAQEGDFILGRLLQKRPCGFCSKQWISEQLQETSVSSRMAHFCIQSHDDVPGVFTLPVQHLWHRVYVTYIYYTVWLA